MKLYTREWGKGTPVIALHPLGLDSSGFAGVGRALARRGLRTIAADLPGFGQTPAPRQHLDMATLAGPVVDLAKSLETPPVVLGVSLGGRVALEAALLAPDTFRAVVPIAPYLPWLRFRPLLQGARLLSPALAARLPLERVWPLLRLLAAGLENVPWLRNDELAQAGARLVYYFACPATRASFVSAARELALDPAYGENGFWSRMRTLRLPAGFVWGERDQLIAMGFAHRVAQINPSARQIVLPCAGHVLNGPHHRCVAAAVATLVAELDAPAHNRGAGAAARRQVGDAELTPQPCRIAAATRRAHPRPVRAA